MSLYNTASILNHSHRGAGSSGCPIPATRLLQHSWNTTFMQGGTLAATLPVMKLNPAVHVFSSRPVFERLTASPCLSRIHFMERHRRRVLRSFHTHGSPFGLQHLQFNGTSHSRSTQPRGLDTPQSVFIACCEILHTVNGYHTAKTCSNVDSPSATPNHHVQQ
jgi:hypothetical protein